jgi:hypothetical protein
MPQMKGLKELTLPVGDEGTRAGMGKARHQSVHHARQMISINRTQALLTKGGNIYTGNNLCL